MRPCVEHGQPVAHRERLLLVVRDVDERDADRLLDVLELDLHLLAQLEVERAERLVQQQHAGPVDERAGERDALALSARELARLAAGERVEPHERERLDGALAPLGLGDALDAQAVLDVLLHGHVREQRVVLEDRVDVALVRRARGHVARRRAARVRSSAARSRRSCAGRWSCRSPTVRAARRTRRARRRDRRRRRRRTRRNASDTPSSRTLTSPAGAPALALPIVAASSTVARR